MKIHSYRQNDGRLVAAAHGEVGASVDDDRHIILGLAGDLREFRRRQLVEILGHLLKRHVSRDVDKGHRWRNSAEILRSYESIKLIFEAQKVK